MIIDTSKPNKINFAPTLYEDIEQNIRMILNTMFFSVPNNRGLGLNATYLDAPTNQAEIRLRIDITKKINKDEPRVKIESINFKSDPLSGYLNPIVRVSINE